MVDAFGAINWWGFSPALDFQDGDINVALKDLKISECDELNVLMIGAGDCRHILKTLAYAYRHGKRKINFYILEGSAELYARHLLLLSICLEPQQRMGLQEKTELFLEVYGNTLVRQQTAHYVEKMASDFIKMVTNFDYLQQKMPLVDMSLLKFKERDMLEAIFKFWRNSDKEVFDVQKAWELRLRSYLGQRYDAIPNVFDWDFSMKLAEKGAEVINYKKYQRWRMYGSAFEIREGTYDIPNKTLASGMVFKHEGDRLLRRGYWGDIIVSPYITFGIESEETRFFTKQNNHFIHTAEDVAEYNMLAMFHELASGTKYVPPAKDEGGTKPPVEKATLTEITEEEEEEAEEEVPDEVESDPSGKDANLLDLQFEALPLPEAKVLFLPMNSAPELHNKSRFQGLFNLVYISNSLVHRLTPEITETFTESATVILETAKFMLELKVEQQKEFVSKIIQIADSVGCKLSGTLDPNDSHLNFQFTRKSSS